MDYSFFEGVPAAGAGTVVRARHRLRFGLDRAASPPPQSPEAAPEQIDVDERAESGGYRPPETTLATRPSALMHVDERARTRLPEPAAACSAAAAALIWSSTRPR